MSSLTLRLLVAIAPLIFLATAFTLSDLYRRYRIRHAGHHLKGATHGVRLRH